MQRIRDAQDPARRSFGSDSCRFSLKAFSFVELLVVVATGLTLAGLFLPSFVGATEKNRRVTCNSHLRQFLLGIHMYANDNFGRLPSGRSDKTDLHEHIPVVSAATRACLIQYAGNARLLQCPSLLKPFNIKWSWYDHESGSVLGYNYLGGRSGTPWPVTDPSYNWISPQTVNDDTSSPLITDINDWSPGCGRAFAPHGTHGPIFKGNDSNARAPGPSSKDIGAAGGNVGLLDGSANWKSIRQMQSHAGSRLQGDSYCLAAW